jgi:agmatine/peptidylarginine deiminase
MNNRFLPAEWYPQSAVQFTWPHENTDWIDILDEVTICFSTLVTLVATHQKVIIVCPSKDVVLPHIQDANLQNIIFAELPSNDTWARDHGGITVIENGKPTILDFRFNGWGLKFASNFDNQITSSLFKAGIFNHTTAYENQLGFALEGGGIESDGKGTILTTSFCLLSPNRNGHLTKQEIETYILNVFNAQRILWLDHGYLAGDDTDSHIDTLARLCDENTIAYVKCQDESDEHFNELKAMEDELKAFRTLDGKPYQLIALPMADVVYDDEDPTYRLPATYANFLITNETVLVPIYNSPKDQIALDMLQEVFKTRKVIGVDCISLIKQHGSLHCVTMQYPAEVI